MTTKKINEANRATWDEWNKTIARTVATHPNVARLAVELHSDCIRRIVAVFGEDRVSDAVKATAGIEDAILRLAEVIADLQRTRGGHGGGKTAEHWQAVADEAVRLATERKPPEGWRSAPQAAKAILPDVMAFARKNGRALIGDDPMRTVTGWLRTAGIKRPKK